MIVALIDNGSLEPAAHRNLRELAATLSARTEVKVHAVSWKHSDRIAPEALDGLRAWSLASFVRQMVALGQREFLFVPFFISPQGAIGSALQSDLERLQSEVGEFEFDFTPGLADRGVLPTILADRIRVTIAQRAIAQPPVLLVDHGGPSLASATLRDRIADEVRRELGLEIGPLVAASMEGEHPPLLAHELRRTEFAGRDLIVARLFLSPGRHAGEHGDVAQLCLESTARCHLTDLVGTHPAAVDALAAALRDSRAAIPMEAGRDAS
jgi:sirohydrochlorin ferrochelatase